MSDKPSVYVEGKTSIYRASRLSLPVFCLAAIRMGATEMLPPEWLMERFEQGHELEDEILRLFEEDQLDLVKGRQREVELLVTPTVTIVGHIDGETEDTVVDAKAFAQSTWDKLEAEGLDGFPSYQWQMSMYMHATGKKGCLAVYNKDTGAMKYVWIEEPPFEKRQLFKKVLEAEKCGKSGKLPDPPTENHWPCPVYYMHPAEFDSLDDEGLKNKLDGLSETYDEARSLEKRGKELKKKAGKEIEELLEQAGVEKVMTPSFTVTLVENKGRARLDKGAMEEAGIDLDRYTTRTPYTYTKVTRRETDED